MSTAVCPPCPLRCATNVALCMAHNLLMHTCADLKRALAVSAPMRSWRTAGSGLTYAIVGLLLALLTPNR